MRPSRELRAAGNVVLGRNKREVAEDLFQEVWIRVLKRGSQYNGKARFDTWIFTIARNLVIDLSRKRTMASLDEMREGGEDERPFEIAQDGPSPLEQFEGREDAILIAFLDRTVRASQHQSRQQTRMKARHIVRRGSNTGGRPIRLRTAQPLSFVRLAA